MRKSGLVGMGALFVMASCAGVALAADENVTAKKLQIKDNLDPIKRQIQVQSADLAVQYTDADSPGTKGASLHFWSASDDYCLVLPASPTLWQDTGKAWKYKNPDTKNQATIQDKKVSAKVKSGVTFTLSDDEPQGSISASIQFGDTGSRFCMTCPAPTKDEEFMFQAKDCVAGSCIGEPPGCLPTATTTTTSTTTTTTTSTTSTTTTTLGGTVVGAIQTNGRFNINMGMGIPAAQAGCNAAFPGSHLCNYSELLASQGAPMTGLTATNATVVTELWAFDPARPGSGQCADNGSPDSARWVYATGHLGIGGDSVPLTNATGMLGALSFGGGGNRNCGATKWIGCCQ